MIADSLSRPIHIVGEVGRGSDGVGAVAVSLTRHQVLQGCDARIWCSDTLREVEWAGKAAGIEPVRFRRFERPSFGFAGYTPTMERGVRQVPDSEKPDVVHQHSMWHGLSRVTLEWAKRRVPTVIAAHGALQPWGLRKSYWKKKAAYLAWEARNLRQAACLHACGENEVGDYREFGLKNPIALLPNAIGSEWTGSVGRAEDFRTRYGIPAETRILLYLSRITPKKGLPMLLEAMAGLRQDLQSWVLVIAGHNEFGHQSELETQIRALDLSGRVLFVGPQYEQNKRDAYAAADLFVLPTHSEGNPMVVLEALGAGVPVLTTKGAPWSDLDRYRCGWWCDVSAASIHDSLKAAAGLPKQELLEAGRRGRALVQTRYNWADLASRTIRLYGWLTGHGPRPEFVNVV